MFKNVSLVFLILICILSNNSYAQELPEIIPPSPESSALSNYTEVPVSLHTGLQNISVPIYTIKTKGLNLPIQLNYHARGVKVSDIAPRTGTGWSLIYGGRITRQMRGRSDESPHGYLSNSSRFINYSTNLQTRQNVHSQNSSGFSYDFDFYPDQFAFNIGGLSGKFILDYVDGQPLLQSYGDVKIDYFRESNNSGRIISFIIKDSKGNTYYFGKSKDGSRSAQDYQDSNGYSVDYQGNQNLDPNPSDDDSFYSAWKLMDIETAFGELIHFYYELDASGLAYWKKTVDKHIPSEGTSTTGMAGISDITKIITKVSRINNYEYQLRKIEFNNSIDKIEFLKESNIREDFDGYALDKIEVYHKAKLIKGYDLNYEYTHSTDSTNILSHFTGSNFSKYFKRLFLKNVQQYDANDLRLPPYEFSYDSQVLPSHFSSRQDYWGYYNGAQNNGPFTRLFEYGSYNPDRRVDTLKSEAGILKQIKYPTGGVSNFIYEHNIGSLPFTFNNLELPEINPGSSDQGQVEIVLTKSDFLNDQGGLNSYSVDLPNNVAAKVVFSCSHLQYYNEDDDSTEPSPSCIFYFSVNGSSVNYGNNSMYELGEEITFYSGSNGDNLNLTALQKNEYSPSNLYLDSNYDFTITIRYDTPDTISNLYAAGKRIKRIETIDENQNILIKEFEYVYPSITLGANNYEGAPSGNIIGLPAYLNKRIDGYDGGIVTHTAYFDATGTYSSFQQNTIGYSSVIEYNGTKNNNKGKIEHTFTNFNDSGGDYYEFPYHPPTDNEWLRGKPIKVNYYKNDGSNNYTLVKEVHNKYIFGGNTYDIDFSIPFGDGGFEFSDDTTLTNQFIFIPSAQQYDWLENAPAFNYQKNRTNYRLPLFMLKRNKHGCSDCDYVNNPYEGYRIYDFTGGTINLYQTKEKKYNDLGVLETLTTYNYDYNNHYQLKSTSTLNSNNDEVSVSYYFPTDINDLVGLSSETANASNDLINQNRYEVIETITQKNQNELSKVRTNYKTFYNGLINPSNVQVLKANTIGSNQLEDRIEYHEYDDFGNPLEVSKADGTHIVYIWGYNHTQPIAKIENITYQEVQSYVSGLQLLSDADIDHCTGSNCTEQQLRDALNNLRVSLPKALVSTYTYDPLIGVTSMTDARGQTVHYEYDEFNRLKHVKDEDGNILSENQYHYSTQN